MKIKWNMTKRSILFFAAFAAASAAGYAFCGISAFNAAAFALLYFAVIHLEVEWQEKRCWLISVLAIGAGSILTAWLMQYLLLVEDLRGRLSNEMFLLNILCVLVVYLLAQTCINHVGAACITAHILLMIFAGANYFVYAFRGNELTFADLRTVSTGLSVASNYRFTINAQAMNAILLTAVFTAGAAKLKIKFNKAFRMRLICVSVLILSALYVTGKTKGRMTETWEQKGTYQNGYFLNFLLSIRDSFVKKPESYSADLISNFEQEYQKEDASALKEKPTVIVIMNESFADFDVIGNLETNQPVTPFLDSLTENTTRGYVLASVYGAKTPNSEWEFLTGNSMAHLPSGSVPYQQYVEEENAYSLVDIMKSQGYSCVAMHPYFATGWSRDSVYPKFGFDEMYFLDDFNQGNLMRKYVSDFEMYDKVIQRYEAGQDGENLFLMGITMQNHGGYRDFYENFRTDVYGTNIRYPDVNQYLSLIHQSDLAAEKLISYFSKVKKPVVICFFGDHQPSLNTAFYARLNGKGLSGLTLSELQELYTVPFFIWTNFESESETVERTSLNFLSTLLLKKANLPLSPYQQFLSDLMEVAPAINARAYYSNALGKYVHFGEGTPADEVWIERYRNLQYNGLFDDKNRSMVFFGRKSEGNGRKAED